ncbi:MAG: lipocalin-like domain-containing protein [Proteobacteria bacterium]|nr:lipocalin-like domain-containing protein [Pseudomonadota bacterium]MBS0494766.1 lipocalin-like domain-containing protein [Pseudomonadota bacterium]
MPSQDPLAALCERVMGSWRILSWTRRLSASGERADALGAHPFGYINYAPDGRVMVFVLRGDRPRPAHNPPSPAEKLALFDSMFAYVGRYEVQPDRVIHTLDGSWNELWTGTRQTRLLHFDGPRLVYDTPETIDPMDGQLCTYQVTFERA